MFAISGVAAALLSIPIGQDTSAGEPPAVVVHSQQAGFQERLAGREIRRYVYLRTGELLPLAQTGAVPAAGDAIVIEVDSSLEPQQYRLRTRTRRDRRVLRITGGSGVATLYGAYHLVEKLGVRFYLHGDVIPDEKIAFTLPRLDETHRPLFELRGVNPWGSHPFGFDLWNADDYQAHVGQLAKMRMNFIGMHCYGEGHPYAEPTVWVGLPGDFDRQGRVALSYPSSYYTAAFAPAWGGLRPGKTGDYHLGAAMLFDRDDWGPDAMLGQTPRPSTPEGCNEVFNRTAATFREAFSFARLVGVKTCIGTESPLTVPQVVREKLEQQGKDPADPAVVQQVYEGIFQRIAAAHPLDYYWLWTPEDWTWRGNAPEQIKATVDDVKIARAALKKVGDPFRLATCGWVLGPKDDRAGFDRHLPPGVALSAISRQLGEDPVDPAYGRVQRRDKWAIPWMEGDNGGLAVPQLWVGRTRQDALDAHRYGCTGLMGLIWRTRILGPNVAALAQAGWEQPWRDRAMPAQPPGDEPKLPEGARGGRFANYPRVAVAGTEDDVLYRTCRYDTRGYDLKVPDGSYRVTLKFCEPHFDSAGKRVCRVKLQGRTVIQRLDIFAKVGKFAALDCTFDDVGVSNSQLALELVYIESLPCISGIVVEGRGFVRKINCGGPQHRDYAADFPLSATAPNSLRLRKIPCGDFYADWAAALFGPAGAEEIANVFAKIDSRLPRPLCQGCPAGVRPDRRPWEQVAPSYAFVDDLAGCRNKITGRGNLARFDYWLGTMQYLRAGARLDCAVGKFQLAMAKVNARKEPQARKRLAAEAALPVYREILAAYTEAFGHLLHTSSTNGALATVMYWEHSFYRVSLDNTARALSQALGEPLPTDAQLPNGYQGRPRLIVPTVRSSLAPGEVLRLKVIVLSADPPRGPDLLWREMGRGAFKRLPLEHVARGVYTVAFPPGGATSDLEYFVEAATSAGQLLRFPPTAPAISQTLVLIPTQQGGR